ncbi:hypothetical protein HYH02_003559 [Chlamydomonas schloesseri]|uniref:Uncharacterized protein n=1 Tax=Chlamydomonas schloesseri TaxID=2026947 RepID=A0A835WQI8_9CHLO|nr:hypothetical protein HYH02_003559 [Chlamydomonas schloesseri]|eukprot:KAG2451781.1 hypothetical protein HYH02_003559 [Chlamydomonas schloesseri]
MALNPHLRAVRWGAVALAFVAVVSTLAGLFAPSAIEKALHQAIMESVVWRPDSPPEVDARYRGYPADPAAPPDYFRVWLWNLTNLPDVRRGAKPHMVEVGPLTYIKRRVKVDVWWDRRGRVAVKEWDYHIFQPQLSAPLGPNDTITTLNLPLLGALELLHAYSASVPAVRPLLDVLVGVLSGWRDPEQHVDGLFARRTPAELLWGYEDLLLQRLQLLLGPAFIPSTRVQLIPNDTSPEHVRLHQPPNVVDTGWRPAGLDPEAGGGDASGEVEPGGTPVPAGGPGDTATGRRGGAGHKARVFVNERKIWNIEREAGWSNVTSWGPNCTERVRGTDAFQFRPGLQRNESLRVWITELFRSAALLYRGDVELHGIKLFRFEPDPREGEPDPCHHQAIRGLANVTVPQAVGPNGNGSDANGAAHGVPLFMSLPHFCLVDPAVSAALGGVECDPRLHTTYIDVEPTTGVTMRAAKRLQLSSQLSDTARATLEPGIASSLLLPVFWAEEASQVSEAQAAAFRGSVYRVQALVAALRAYALPVAAVAAALAVGAGGAAFAAARRQDRRQAEDGVAVEARGVGDEEGGPEGGGGDGASLVARMGADGGGGGGTSNGPAGLSQPLLSEGAQ